MPDVNSGSLKQHLQQEKLKGIKRQRRLDHEQAWNDSTLIIGIHAPNIDGTACKDLSYLTCFNNNKNGHYATKYPKPMKNRDTLED